MDLHWVWNGEEEFPIFDVVAHDDGEKRERHVHSGENFIINLITFFNQ